MPFWKNWPAFEYVHRFQGLCVKIIHIGAFDDEPAIYELEPVKHLIR